MSAFTTIIQWLFVPSQWLFVLGFLVTLIYGGLLAYHAIGDLTSRRDADSWNDTLNAGGILIYSLIALISVFSISSSIKLIPQTATNILTLVSFVLVTHKLFLIATGHIYIVRANKYKTAAWWIFGTGLVIAFFAIVLSALTTHPAVIRSYAGLHKILFCYFFVSCAASLLELVLTPLNTVARMCMGLIVAVSGFGLVVSLPFNGAHEDTSVQWNGEKLMDGLTKKDLATVGSVAVRKVEPTKSSEASSVVSAQIEDDTKYAKSTWYSWMKEACADLGSALDLASKSLKGKFGNKLILLIASVCATITAVVAFTMTTMFHIAGWNSFLLSSLYFIPYFLVMYWNYNKADKIASEERRPSVATRSASGQGSTPKLNKAKNPPLPNQVVQPQTPAAPAKPVAQAAPVAQEPRLQAQPSVPK